MTTKERAEQLANLAKRGCDLVDQGNEVDRQLHAVNEDIEECLKTGLRTGELHPNQSYITPADVLTVFYSTNDGFEKIMLHPAVTL